MLLARPDSAMPRTAPPSLLRLSSAIAAIRMLCLCLTCLLLSLTAGRLTRAALSPPVPGDREPDREYVRVARVLLHAPGRDAVAVDGPHDGAQPHPALPAHRPRTSALLCR